MRYCLQSIIALQLTAGLGFAAQVANAQPVTQFAPVEDSSPAPPGAQTSTLGSSSLPRSRPQASAGTTLESSADEAERRDRLVRGSPTATQPLMLSRDTAEPRSRFDASVPDARLDAGSLDDESADSRHYLAVSFSVARMFASLYELTAEVRLAERLSIAALVGMGEFEATVPQLGEKVHLSGREFGGQARFYMIGGFDHGVFLGAEWLRVWAQTASDDLVQGSGTLTGTGGFLGYKVSADFGLTFDAKVGIQKLSIIGEGTATGEFTYMGQTQIVSASESIDERRTLPLLNVNLGWAI